MDITTFNGLIFKHRQKTGDCQLPKPLINGRIHMEKSWKYFHTTGTAPYFPH